MAAAHFGLDNLVAIVDDNNRFVTGPRNSVMTLDPFGAKWAAFGWHVAEVDGHDLPAVIDVLETARRPETAPGKPRLVIAHTVKGKGVPFMEASDGWHVGHLTADQYQCGAGGGDAMSTANLAMYGVAQGDIRQLFGEALVAVGQANPNVVVLDCQTAMPTAAVSFARAFPERFIDLGIAEQNAVSFAAGPARMGFVPSVHDQTARRRDDRRPRRAHRGCRDRGESHGPGRPGRGVSCSSAPARRPRRVRDLGAPGGDLPAVRPHGRGGMRGG